MYSIMKHHFLLPILSLLLACYSCEQEHVFVKKESTAPTLFTEVPTSVSNIEFMNQVQQSKSFSVLNYFYAITGGGVAVGDVNNDGLVDLYFTSNQNTNALYINKGDFNFENQTETAGVADKGGWTTGTSMIDINNDGWLDIYVCKSASLKSNNLRRNKLYVNNQDGTFTESARLWGLDNDGFSIQSYFFDYDKDGDLDMYLVNHRHDFKHTNRLEGSRNKKFYPQTSDHLFRNEGNRFVDVTPQANLINKQWGLSAAIGDFNNDNWPDIYVANDFIGPDFLYINNQDGTFSNEIRERMDHISYNSMGTDYADINNDLLPDLITLEMSAEDHVRSKQNMPTMDTEGFRRIVASKHHYPYMTNTLQLNRGNGSFSDIAQLAGISKTDWSWAPLVADFDNDGWKDIFITNGIDRSLSNQDYLHNVDSLLASKKDLKIAEVLQAMPSDTLSNYSFRNNGDLTFTNTTQQWGLDLPANTNGAAYADLDNDGDMDLILNSMGKRAAIYQNNSTGNYINIQLQGAATNPDAIGAKVTVYTDSLQQYQELYTNRGYQSSVDRTLNFGVGEATTIQKIEVIWDNNTVSILENSTANQTITLSIADANGQYIPKSNDTTTGTKSIDPTTVGIDFVHQENEYNDFSKQVLLPQQLSTQGPAMAVADVNADGLEDLYLGGASGQASALYLQNTAGTFDAVAQPAFEKDKAYEDQGAVFFDADQDGDMDVYVASGGYELSADSPLLQDRLYLNNGKGIYHKAQLPRMSSSSKAIQVIDYDQDQDLDLIIGGHVIPGQYPLAPSSYVLNNTKGTFTDVTKTVAPDLATIGIINDMTATDYDQDGDQDLIIVGEWIPITFLENKKGTLHITPQPALAKTHGWWQSIEAVDIDKDGDMDYIVGNIGDNNKFHPTAQKPLHIYSQNFDTNDSYDMVLSKTYKGSLVPVRGKECSTEQNPFIASKIKTYKDFALSSMADIYGTDALESAYHKEVYLFSSVALINEPTGFSVQKLPSTAQMGPTMDIEIIDIDSDGYLDIVGIGAIHETEVETIRYDGNTGYILRNDTQGGFVPYTDIGFYSKKNAKKMKQLTIGGQQHLVIANNNSGISIFNYTKD